MDRQTPERPSLLKRGIAAARRALGRFAHNTPADERPDPREGEGTIENPHLMQMFRAEIARAQVRLNESDTGAGELARSLMRLVGGIVSAEAFDRQRAYQRRGWHVDDPAIVTHLKNPLDSGRILAVNIARNTTIYTDQNGPDDFIMITVDTGGVAGGAADLGFRHCLNVGLDSKGNPVAWGSRATLEAGEQRGAREVQHPSAMRDGVVSMALGLMEPSGSKPQQQ